MRIIILVLVTTLCFCGAGSYVYAGMILSSPDFKNDQYIPDRFTCKGQGVNPALEIENIPPDTQSLALIIDDPDAPSGVWSHWVVYDIPLTNRINENSSPGICGVNDFGNKKYDGPCPPFGQHRYFFKVYALDAKLNLFGLIDKATLERNMQGHILDQAQVFGNVKK